MIEEAVRQLSPSAPMMVFHQTKTDEIAMTKIHAEIRLGDALTVLKTLPSESVNCCITSPPYFGAVRDYNVSGQLGHERTPDEYITKLVAVFGEVRRVLKPDGTLWINIGDTYATGSGGRNTKSEKQKSNKGTDTAPRKLLRYGDLKHKDLIGIPWMLAFALRSDGWYLRQEIIWHKPSCVPESVKDRPTRAHEQIFLFSKSAKYYYDADAIKEPAVTAGKTRMMGSKNKINKDRNDGGRTVKTAEKRNKRTVWAIAPQSGKRSRDHHAMFPILIPEMCLKAGCPDGGIVLDPFSGTATTGSAAILHGRKYQGIELNRGYAWIGTQIVMEDGRRQGEKLLKSEGRI